MLLKRLQEWLKFKWEYCYTNRLLRKNCFDPPWCDIQIILVFCFFFRLSFAGWRRFRRRCTKPSSTPTPSGWASKPTETQRWRHRRWRPSPLWRSWSTTQTWSSTSASPERMGSSPCSSSFPRTTNRPTGDSRLALVSSLVDHSMRFDWHTNLNSWGLTLGLPAPVELCFY